MKVKSESEGTLPLSLSGYLLSSEQPEKLEGEEGGRQAEHRSYLGGGAAEGLDSAPGELTPHKAVGAGGFGFESGGITKASWWRWCLTGCPI